MARNDNTGNAGWAVSRAFGEAAAFVATLPRTSNDITVTLTDGRVLKAKRLGGRKAFARRLLFGVWPRIADDAAGSIDCALPSKGIVESSL